MKIDKLEGRKVAYVKGGKYNERIQKATLKSVIRRGAFVRAKVTYKNGEGEDRAESIDPDNIIAYFDENINDWIDLEKNG